MEMTTKSLVQLMAEINDRRRYIENHVSPDQEVDTYEYLCELNNYIRKLSTQVEVPRKLYNLAFGMPEDWTPAAPQEEFIPEICEISTKLCKETE